MEVREDDRAKLQRHKRKARPELLAGDCEVGCNSNPTRSWSDHSSHHVFCELQYSITCTFYFSSQSELGT
jgi:hypothetical protein